MWSEWRKTQKCKHKTWNAKTLSNLHLTKIMNNYSVFKKWPSLMACNWFSLSSPLLPIIIVWLGNSKKPPFNSTLQRHFLWRTQEGDLMLIWSLYMNLNWGNNWGCSSKEAKSNSFNVQFRVPNAFNFCEMHHLHQLPYLYLFPSLCSSIHKRQASDGDDSTAAVALLIMHWHNTRSD